MVVLYLSLNPLCIDLFCGLGVDACFRIAAEAGIPIVVENVKGAQPWVGRAKWHYGSYYLWGDVPALMPSTFRGVMKLGVAHRSNGETNFHGSAARAGQKNDGGSWFAIGSPGQTETNRNPVHDGLKVPGITWSGSGKQGYKAAGLNLLCAERKSYAAR